MAKAVPTHKEDPQLKRLRAHATQLTLSKRHDLAEAIWRELLAKLPRDPGLHRQLANCLLNLRRIDEAFEEAQTAVTLNPASHELLLMLGLMHRMHGRYEQATVAHRQALELKPDYLPALLGMALDLQVQLRWPEALDWANRGLALKPTHVELLRIRGKALAITGQHDEARVVMDEFLRLAPDAAESHRTAAIILRRLGRVAEAADSAQRAMVMNPADPLLHNDLASIKLRERNFEEADRHFKAAAEIYDSRRDGQRGPKGIEIHSLLGQAVFSLNKRRFQVAESQYRRVLEIDPARHTVTALLGAIAGAQYRFDEAIDLVQKAIQSAPNAEVPRRILASLRANIEQHDEALILSNELLATFPNSAELLRTFAIIYLDLDDYAKALEWVDRAITVKSSASIRRVRAAALAGLRRGAEAVQTLEDTQREEPASFYSAEIAGYVFYRLGDYAVAEAHLLQARSLDESGLGGHGWLGLVYAAQGRLEEARTMLLKAVELNPHERRAREALTKLDNQ